MHEFAQEWCRYRLGEVFADTALQLLSLASAKVPQTEIARMVGYKDASVVKKKAGALDRDELRQMLEHPRVY